MTGNDRKIVILPMELLAASQWKGHLHVPLLNGMSPVALIAKKKEK